MCLELLFIALVMKTNDYQVHYRFLKLNLHGILFYGQHDLFQNHNHYTIATAKAI